MAVRAHPYPLRTVQITFVSQRARATKSHGPRRCMVVSVGLIFSGLGIPFLMAIGLLPITLLLGLVGLGLAAGGGIMALIFCGEI
jgi:hypothetical protein